VRFAPQLTGRVPLVDLLHYPLSPSDGIGDGSYGSRNPRSAVVLRQFASRKDTGGDQQHALPTLIHLRSLAFSPYVRHSAAGRADAHARGGEVCDVGADTKVCTW